MEYTRQIQGRQDETRHPTQQFYPVLYKGYNYLSTLGLKIIHVGKRGPRCPSICFSKHGMHDNI